VFPILVHAILSLAKMAAVYLNLEKRYFYLIDRIQVIINIGSNELWKAVPTVDGG
jgi:hypothetical protein